MRRGVRVLFLLTIIAFSLALAFYGGHLYFREAEEVRAMENMRKLAALTIRDYPEGNPPLGDRSLEFWKRLGRDGPIQDPWGHDFVLERREDTKGTRALFSWGSAGPDGLWQTADDLKVIVPYAGPVSAGSGNP